MTQYNYKSFWEFLKDTPRNLLSAILISATSILFIVMAIITREDFDPEWLVFIILGFMPIMIFLAWYRVWKIYKGLDRFRDDYVPEEKDEDWSSDILDDHLTDNDLK